MKLPEKETSTHIYFFGSFLSQWAIYPFEDEKIKKLRVCFYRG